MGPNADTGWQRSQMRRLLPCLAVIAILHSPAFAEDRFNVDFQLGWGGCYRPSSWTPIQLEITSNLDEPLDATVSVAMATDELTRMTVRQQLVLMPRSVRYVPLVTKVASGGGNSYVAIRNAKGRALWERLYNPYQLVGNNEPLKMLGEDDCLIGLVGAGSYYLLDMPEQSSCGNGDGRVYVGAKTIRNLPWDWTGYDSLDVLVLADVDWTMMHPTQARAIAQWVRKGGSVLLVVGSNPLPADHPLASLLPFGLSQPRQVRVEGNDNIPGWGAMPDSLTCWTMSSTTVPHWRFESFNMSQPVFAVGRVDMGMVGVLCYSPSQLGRGTEGSSSTFWAYHLSPLVRWPITATSRPRGNDDYGSFGDMTEAEAEAGTMAILEHLMRIPQLRPLSIWWIIGLLGLLTVLIGPVDYIVLKRLGRLPLTWLTTACVIAVFSVGAYYGVQAIRGNTMRVRMVSVVDGISGRPGGQATTYSGLFAPATANYRLEGLADGQWFSTVSPTSGRRYYGGTSVPTRNLYCNQADGGNLPYSVPINIWSMQVLVCEETVESMPFSAEVQLRGGQVTVTVTNHSDSPIVAGAVAMKGMYHFRFGSVDPGETATFSEAPTRSSNWTFLPDKYRDITDARFSRDMALSAMGVLRRTQAIQRYVADGAAVVSVEYADVPAPFDVSGYRAEFDHIQLARLVVFPVKGQEQ